MINIEHLAHTADIRIRLQASTLQELFEGGLQVIADILKPGFRRGQTQAEIKREVDLDSMDQTALFIDFLSEIVTLSHTELAIYDQIDLRHLTDRSVKATLRGQHVGCFEEDIKAVTYHEAHVHKNKNGHWETMLILDI